MLGAKVKKRIIDSIPLNKCIAKTTNNKKPGITVEIHSLIVGFVAQNLIALFPEQMQSDLFPTGTDLIAALHDIGKVSPAFQKMIYQNLDNPEKEILNILDSVNWEHAKRRQPGFHAAISQVSLEGIEPYIPEILGIHHGFTPNTNNYVKGCSLHGGETWQTKREELINRIKRNLSYEEKFWPLYTAEQAKVIAGLVTVSDWIGSGDFYDSLMRDEVYNLDTLKDLSKEAVSKAGFLPFKIKKDLLFEEIFPFKPNKIQSTSSINVNAPGLYILEAPMGIGKTEAALYAAYRLLNNNKAKGIYFALPTQLTSEKIYDRMKDFVKKITTLNPLNGEIQLLHSASWLKETSMGENADAGGSWFDNTKRGILAPFAVGTIDQALMAVLNIRHSLVRTFGLAGKVVILDEVHSYDAYTGTILNALVKELLKINCTVIILSATLTKEQKKVLIQTEGIRSSDYPLISTKIEGEIFLEINSPLKEQSNFSIKTTQKLNDAIEITIDKALQGEQVLWIENTVQDSQEIYKLLSARTLELNIEIGLLHSRFLKKDRAEIETKWVSIYGKEGFGKRKEKGRILIGTQVLEQSIDIDADFLVTRICPTDMLLQRIGRIWRHKENNTYRKTIKAKPEVLVLAPKLQNIINKQDGFGKTKNIYSEYVLLRSLEVIENVDTITIPNQIRDLIESTYIERQDTDIALTFKQELLDKKDSLQRMARIGLSTAIKTLPESYAKTRFSEIETTEVLILINKKEVADGVELTFLDNTKIVLPHTYNKQTKRSIALEIKRNMIKVGDYIAPKICSNVSVFKNYTYVGSKENEEQPFRVVLISRDNELHSFDGSEANSDYILYYDKEIGYQHKKRQEEK